MPSCFVIPCMPLELVGMYTGRGVQYMKPINRHAIFNYQQPVNWEHFHGTDHSSQTNEPIYSVQCGNTLMVRNNQF